MRARFPTVTHMCTLLGGSFSSMVKNVCLRER
jgi:hypothetical protein